MAGAVVDGGVGAGSMWLRAICCGLGAQLKAVKHGVYLILITLAARTQKAKQTHFVIPQLVIFFFFFLGLSHRKSHKIQQNMSCSSSSSQLISILKRSALKTFPQAID